ncbi:MAG: HAMP domain-containing histidine kinase [Clostridia bacterium]|nr:HAMP domain-containing histidine kinase [Clostridia bacterium]
MSFRQKILITMVWLLTLAYGVGGMLLISQSFESGMEQEKKNAAASYQMMLETVELVNLVDTQRDFANLTESVARMDARANWRGLRLRKGGESIYENGGVFTDASPARGYGMVVFREGEGHFLQIAGDIDASGEAVSMDIVFDVTPVYEARESQIAIFRKVFLLLLLVGGGLSWLTAWLLTRPIYKISRAAGRLAEGDLSSRIRTRSRDELGELARDFNDMAGKLEENVGELRESFERQERFMGSFAHEMKTPMTSIIGYADLLRSDSLSEEDKMTAANYIFSEGKRLEALSLKLLDLLVAKNDKMVRKPTDMASLVSGLCEHLKPVFQSSGIILQYKVTPLIFSVEPDLIKTVIYNLIDNARKALENGGNIYVVLDAEGENCRIRVLDNGRGMPEEAIAHITDAFYRVDKARSRAMGGVGLGLSLCNEIVNRHNGRLSFASREGSGTCVTVLLGKEEGEEEA